MKSLLLLSLFCLVNNGGATKANPLYLADEFVYTPYNVQCFNLRLHKENKETYQGQFLGARWGEWDEFEDYHTSNDVSLFRLPLHASASGDYNITFKVMGTDYIVKVFVNNDTPFEHTFAGSWDAPKEEILTVNLNEGNNVVLIQVRKWGGIESYKLPDGLTYINDDSGNTYNIKNHLNLCMRLQGDILDPSSSLNVGPFVYDSDDGYNSKSTVKVTNSEDTSAVHFTYKLDSVAPTGSTGLNLSINGGTAIPLAFSDLTLNTWNEYVIDAETLYENGYIFGDGETNTLTFTAMNANNSGRIYLNTLSLDNDGGEIPEELPSTFVEAEDCVIHGRYVVRTPVSEAETWSGGKYVGNLGPESPISSASQITMDGKTVKVVEVSTTVEMAGRYSIQVAYATSGASDSIFYKANEDSSFRTIPLPTTGNWATPCLLSSKMYVNLHAGTNTIYVTGTISNGTWVNYDYFKITRVLDNDHCYISYPTSPLYVVSELPETINKGEDISFTVALTEFASQFNGEPIVKCNDNVLTKGSNNRYSLTNVQEDVIITVEGVPANRWSIFYYDGEKLIHTDVYEVGATVSFYNPGNKNGYRFVGWEEETPNHMPNNDLTMHAIYEYDESLIDNSRIIITLSVGGSLIVAGGLATGIFFLIRHHKKKKVKVEE